METKFERNEGCKEVCIAYDEMLTQDEYDADRYSLEGCVEMHECISFEKKPSDMRFIRFLQDYTRFLMVKSAFSALEEDADDSKAVTLKAVITINGKVKCEFDSDRIAKGSYDKTDIEALLREAAPEFDVALGAGILLADSFSLDIRCSGCMRAFYNDESDETGERLNMIRKDDLWTGAGMLDHLESFKRREKFEYKLMVYYEDCGTFNAFCIKDGKDIPIPELLSDDAECVRDVWLCNGGLHIQCNRDLYECPEAFAKFKACIRENVLSEHAKDCEEIWDKESENYISGGLMFWEQLENSDVDNVLKFIDEMNRIIETAGEYTEFMVPELDFSDSVYNADVNIFYDIDEFAIAVLTAEDGRLKLKAAVM